MPDGEPVVEHTRRTVLAAGCILAVGGCVDVIESANDDSPRIHDYETVLVEVRTPSGDRLASVTAAIADTSSLRYEGLSGFDSLPPEYGMLFVFDAEAERTFVMREMSFGIDIIFADAAGTISTIHHAPAPAPGEDGSTHRYTGVGQYVLEVGYRWTTEHGVDEGDVLVFDR